MVEVSEKLSGRSANLQNRADRLDVIGNRAHALGLIAGIGVEYLLRIRRPAVGVMAGVLAIHAIVEALGVHLGRYEKAHVARFAVKYRAGPAAKGAREDMVGCCEAQRAVRLVQRITACLR